MEQILIISHVVAGITSLLTGLVAGFFGRKGGKLHRQVGKVFFWCMFWVFISAILIISLVRFNAFLMVIAVFSFYMAFSGYRSLKIKKTRKVETIDWTAGIITLLFGLFMIGMGFNYLVPSFSSVLGYLCLFFGFFTAQNAWENLRMYRKIDSADKMWWWFAHMNSMSGSLIATITAFLVQNGEIFNFPNQLGWMLWVFPTFIGFPIVSYWNRKYKAQFQTRSV
ncbi:hypothetical protein BFP97_14440 [Roseivirga sp. 4D4]|uniref:hypothetical protein n=1 Tax=Roseivirga sp. 4D4 TaxID=1889784 RepID=UPI0008539B33|nr:hypothetical protein [Roseivirga sp. 4D4]OEK02647.1 hypothetical protein BFP97_14440 [Roseivirga sp. 4D4]